MKDFRKKLAPGDIVLNHRHWMCPVIGTDSEYVTVNARHYGKAEYKLEDVQLVPLTDEIITELGWVEIKEGDPDFRRALSLEKEFKHPDYTKMLNITKNALSGMYHTLHGDYTLRYLNDLQHVLWHVVDDTIECDDNNKLHIVN